MMAFDNNCYNVRNLRLDTKNEFTMREIDSLLKIEQKIGEVKSIMVRILIDADELMEQRRQQSMQTFMHDNVD